MTLSLHFKFPSVWFGWFWNPIYQSLCIGLIPFVAIRLQKSPSFAAKRRADNTEVELHPASMWNCPECGRENFARMVRIGQNGERERPADLPPGIEGEWLMAPAYVECKYCTLIFKASDDQKTEPGEEAQT